MRPALIVASLTVLSAAQLAAQAKSCPRSVIDSAGMMSDVFRLADDSMRGRRVGTPENAKARDFIAARFDALKFGTVPPGRVHPFTTPARRGGTLAGNNVVGVLKGSKYPNRYIVVSAHYDHIGVRPAVNGDSIANGADDNASGTAGLLALAKLFANEKPQHSIVFVAFDAEESGDVGSRAWVNASPLPLDSILIDVNMDMVGRNAKNELFAVGATKYPQLRPLVEETAACSNVITLTIGHDNASTPNGGDWTNQSDQGAFHAKGIPFVYFGEEDHPDYHKVTDHPDRLMPGFYAAAVRNVADFVRRFDARPVARDVKR